MTDSIVFSVRLLTKLTNRIEFRDIWHRLRIPDEIDLPKELEKAGLTHMQVFDKKGPGDIPKRKPVRRNRKMKITNTHMKGLDLTKDFVIQK